MNPPVSRPIYLQVLQAALNVDQPRYARQAALDWLAAFPGDLGVACLYARALIAEQRLQQAASVLHGLVRADPQDLAALDALITVEREMKEDPTGWLMVRAALTGEGNPSGMKSTGTEIIPSAWPVLAWQIQQWLDHTDPDARRAIEVEPLLRRALTATAETPAEPAPASAAGLATARVRSAAAGLTNILHLRYLGLRSDIPVQRRLEAARQVTRRFPDSLAAMLWAGVWSIEAGEQDEGVAQLHQVASRDVEGQVAQRLWGDGHAYRSLWPGRLERPLETQVSGAIAAYLGWNRLAVGDRLAELVEPEAEPEPVAPLESAPVSDGPASESAQPQPGAVDLVAVSGMAKGPAGDLAWALADAPATAEALPAANEAQGETVINGSQPPDGAASPAAASQGEAPSWKDSAGERLGRLAFWSDTQRWITRPAAWLQRIWNPVTPMAPAEAEQAKGAYVPSRSGAARPASAGAPGTHASSAKPELRPTSAAQGTPANAAKPAAKPGFQASRRTVVYPKTPQVVNPDLKAVAGELDRLAQRLKMPGTAFLDGRYPVYVVFSLRRRLEKAYGQQAAAQVEAEMAALAQVIQRLPNWGARVILGDVPSCLAPLKLQPVRSGDPWEIKLLLTDLDAALQRTGERLGALLIVGGPEIVPFHHLPNPMDDVDVDVPSDNPYACRDEKPFVPEWPVGRLPGGAGDDPSLILSTLQNIRQSHVQRLPARKGFGEWLGGLWPVRLAARWFGRPHNGLLLRRGGPSFGYTASIWKPAAELVFAPIGQARQLHISPPLGFDNDVEGLPGIGGAGLANKIPCPDGRLGYFNLHGVVDGPNWFGERHPQDPAEMPGYPVALQPADIAAPGSDGGPQIPRIVFSQACYGAHLHGRGIDQSIALRFLAAGAQAVVGSTVTSYGGIGFDESLSASDLLGKVFWEKVQKGEPAGEALLRAKESLVLEMNSRMGFLLPEDQKTLIEFVLYGDPLARAAVNGRGPKSMRYMPIQPGDVRVVCDRAEPLDEASLPPEVLASVRRTVTRYLPGMSDARLVYAHSQAVCQGEGHACPTSQLAQPEASVNPPKANRKWLRRKSRSGPELNPLPTVVTLSKQFSQPEGVHPRIARLTLDEHGKVVKLVVSR